jgi:hypothetical protein
VLLGPNRCCCGIPMNLECRYGNTKSACRGSEAAGARSGRLRPQPVTGRDRIAAAKRPSAACGKLWARILEPSRITGGTSAIR